MAEYIDRQELLENLNKFAPEHYSALVNTLITKQPAADVVEVVRCKDCVHCAVREYDIIDELECEIFDVFTDPLDYCSRGERKQ